MPETFTFDELSKPEEAQDHSYGSLSHDEPQSFSFEELSAPDVPRFDADAAQQPVVTEQELSTARAPWYKPPPEWTTPIGGPTKVMPGADTAAPALTIPLSSLGKAAAGVFDYVRTPQGIVEGLTALTPAAPLVFAKWAKDMIEGGVTNVKEAANTIASMMRDSINRKIISANSLGVPPDANETKTKEYIQDLADNVVNAAMMGAGAVGAARGAIRETARLPERLSKPVEMPPIAEKPVSESAKGVETAPETTSEVAPAQKEIPQPAPAQAPLTGEALPQPSIGKGIAGPLRAKWANATDVPHSEAGFVNIDPLLDMVEGIGRGVKASIEAVKEVGKEAFDPKRMTDYRRSVLSWSSKLQRSFGEAASAQRDINKEVPDPVRREGITNWIQADGDANLLNARASATADPKLKAGYKAALTLTPEEIAIANDVRSTFDALASRGQAHDVLNSFKDNYVPQMWNLGKSKPSGASSRTLRDKFKFSRARTFDSYFDGEQAGFVPKTKDISKILPVYVHEMNSVIAARQLVMDMSKGVASDGRPLVAPRGSGIPVNGASGKATLVAPKAIKGDTGDYKTLDSQPAMTGWRWASKDSAGNDVFVKSDLAIHPEAYSRLKSVLGKSAIKEWYESKGTAAASVPKAFIKFLDIAQGETKKTMLGMLSPFHQVQEGTHAIGHKVNPFFSIPKIDLVGDKGQIDATKHGLMLLPDRATESSFMEGFKNSGLVSKIPLVGKLADRYAHYTFEEYIPGLKYKTYEKILERNMEVFKKELASGEIKPEDVKVISAEQANAAYGHLNYADLGRNPTIQHLARVFLLAPDFLEARARFVGQGAKGLPGAKVGREQLIALGTLAFAQGIGAFLIAKAIGGQWDYKDPFSVRYGDRKYTMRSVPEDLIKLGMDPKMFVRARLSPLVGKGALDYTTGRNWKDEKVTAWETTKELAKEPIPITLRAVLGMGGTSIKPVEQLAGAAGLKISKVPNERAVHYAKVNEAIDALARKAKQLPRNQRQRFMISELRKLGYWDHHAKTRIGRLHPGLYKYND